MKEWFVEANKLRCPSMIFRRSVHVMSQHGNSLFELLFRHGIAINLKNTASYTLSKQSSLA